MAPTSAPGCRAVRRSGYVPGITARYFSQNRQQPSWYRSSREITRNNHRISGGGPEPMPQGASGARRPWPASPGVPHRLYVFSRPELLRVFSHQQSYLPGCYRHIKKFRAIKIAEKTCHPEVALKTGVSRPRKSGRHPTGDRPPYGNAVREKPRTDRGTRGQRVPPAPRPQTERYREP